MIAFKLPRLCQAKVGLSCRSFIKPQTRKIIEHRVLTIELINDKD
jgi:hypothetical protein